MSSTPPTLFPELFGKAPHLVRGFLHSALQLRDLQHLYLEARARYPELELSQKLLKVLNVELDITPQDLARFPETGPVLVVANHPFGILDGMLLDSVLLRARPDIKILTNSLICGIEELRDRVLPIDVFGGAHALEANVKSLRKVIAVLRRGHGIAFFPAGEVSHWRKEFRCITDPPWSDVAVRCSTLTGVPILPLYFQGANSLRFHLGGLIHPRLRTAQLPAELLNKRNRTVEVRVGSLIKASELRAFASTQKASDYLRARTYMLGHRKQNGSPATPTLVSRMPLFAASKPAKQHSPCQPLPAHAVSLPDLERELSALEDAGNTVLQNDDYTVYLERGDKIPALLQEIGRLREVTFRAAGEGTGNLHDIDRFDPYYQHLILWHKPSRQIAGAYRLAWTADVLSKYGINGLYTSTLFRFHPDFFSRMGSALELGRSFVRLEFQKEYAPLLLLWQGIGRTAARRPQSPVLFGAVSISGDYSEASRGLIVQFVSQHGFRHDLAPLATPRHPFRSRLADGFEFSTIGQCLPDLDSLSAPIADIGDRVGVPVLLRQYFKMGGKVVGFNLDRHFSNALDGLLVVDLNDTSAKMIDRYMGPELGRQYRYQIRRPFSA